MQYNTVSQGILKALVLTCQCWLAAYTINEAISQGDTVYFGIAATVSA
jgi:hypothetical protein